MTDLLARLEVAEVGSRELDAAIWYALNEPDVDYPGIHTEQTEQGPREVLTCELGSKWADDVGRYTTCVTAALALAERLYPCWSWSVGQNVHHKYWLAYALALDTDRASFQPTEGTARTPALALSIAILKAKGTEQ
jgi:hypothetical protein